MKNVRIILISAIMIIQTHACQGAQETWLTIFIHGIISVQPFLSIPLMNCLKKDCLKQCVYTESVALIRDDPFFRQAQAMQGIGLEPISMLGTSASSLMARTMDSINALVNPHQENHYYTFGWNGLLSPGKRYVAAEQLYKELSTEYARLKAEGINPHIRIITYSHGGNVALNLAAVKENNPHLPELTIDELLMFGIPVQRETDYLINNEMFKQAYNFYSEGDRVQTIDCFASKKSRRMFVPRKNFEPSEHLIQVELRVTRLTSSKKHAPISIETELKKKAYIYGTAHYLKDVSPGHTELWFFSWTPTLYRQSLPLNPLPAVSIAPLLTNSVKTYLREYPADPKQSIIVDVRPEHDMIITRARGSWQDYTIEPYIPKDLNEEIKTFLLANKPEDHTRKAFKQHTANAHHRGKRLHEKNLKERRKKQPEGM